MSSIHKQHVQLTKELYRAFHFFNQRFTEGKLITPIITVQTTGGMNAYGWFGSNFWTDKTTGKAVSEINLCAEEIGRGSEPVMETLLHEMAHLYNAQNGVRDCTSGQYHNKHFKVAAEMFGLSVSKLSGKGYARTKMDALAEEAYKELNVKHRLFQAVRRKVLHKKKSPYATLVVNPDVKERVTQACTKSNVNQRVLVENALELYMDSLGV